MPLYALFSLASYNDGEFWHLQAKGVIKAHEEELKERRYTYPVGVLIGMCRGVCIGTNLFKPWLRVKVVSHYNGAYAKYTSFSVECAVSRVSKCVCVWTFSMSDMEKRFTCTDV